MQRQKPSSDRHSSISSRPAGEKATPDQPTFYPAYTFKASPTWSKWVKLTCSDIHTVLNHNDRYPNVTTSSGGTLNERRDYNARRDLPLLLFYLNYPIQFVQVTGVVVALEDFFEKFWLFTVDDSSGATIDVTCPRPEKEKSHQKLLLESNSAETTAVETQKRYTATHRVEEDSATDLTLQQTLSRLQLGTVLQAKGTLTTFRQVRQLSLLRLTILPSTAHEMALISSRSQFYASTLSQPWILSRDRQKQLREETQGERDNEDDRAKRRRKREQMKREREVRHRKMIEREYEQEEEERQRGADEARMWGEELKTQVQSRDRRPK